MSLQGSPSTPPSAQRLGPYQIVSQIGSGAIGTVYRAVNVAINEEVALKLLSPEAAGNPILVTRLFREAIAMAKLRHENIVEVYELAESNGLPFIAMEYVEGVDVLRYMRKRGVLPAAEALEIVRQAACALEHAHQTGIVHRDVKPSNLILTRKDGRRLVKLTDFGLVRDLQNQDESHLTRMGAAVGTVDYMAPEQARGSHLADIRSDLYSLGCTLYHMLTGRTPFPQGEFLEKLYKHVHVMPADPRDFTPELSDDVVLLLGKLLAKKPEDRFQTPAELLREIERVQAGEQPYVLAMVAGEEDADGLGNAARPESSTGVPGVGDHALRLARGVPTTGLPPTARLADGSSSDGPSTSEETSVRPRSTMLLLTGVAVVAVLALILYILLS